VTVAAAPTLAELLFGLAAEDILPAAVRAGGPRFFQCFRGPWCDVGVGQQTFPLAAEQLAAERPTMPCPGCGKPMVLVELVPEDPRPCAFCFEPIRPTEKKALDVGAMRWYHEPCIVVAKGQHVSDMATFKSVRHMPDCRHCGQPYQEGHTHILGSVWTSYCDDGAWYRPAHPFQSRSWPHDMIVDSPFYADEAKESHEQAA
jgi:hypothetical protein